MDSSNSVWKNKQCILGRDPQVKPFDMSTNFYVFRTLQNIGDFVLYNHTEYKSEIHIRQQRCSADSSGSCACAVAIQGGGDIFLIDTCGTVKRAHFSRCRGSILNVREINSGKYEVWTIHSHF